MSFGWAMRGSVLGASKGAMLPGALIGLFTAFISGGDPRYFAALGAMGAWFGGGMTYSQSVHIIHRENPGFDPRCGYTGIAVKGGLWFGLIGATLGLGFTAAYYRASELVVLVAAMPLLYELGVLLLNRPHDNTRDIFPPVFFSRGPKGIGYGRKESWGGYLAILLWLLSWFVFKGDLTALRLLICGALGGALGFPAAEWLQGLFKWKLCSGRLARKIDTWKVMEFSLGFFGGFAIALGAFLFRVPVYISRRLGEADLPLTLIWLGALAAYEALVYFSHSLKKTKVEILAWLQTGHITKQDADRMLPDAPEANPAVFSAIRACGYRFNIALYLYIPLLLTLLGSVYTARLMSGTMIFAVLAVQNVVYAHGRRRGSDKSYSPLDADDTQKGFFGRSRHLGLMALACLLLLAASALLDLLRGYPVWLMLTLYLGVYFAFWLAMSLGNAARDGRLREALRSPATLSQIVCFLAQALVTALFALIWL